MYYYVDCFLAQFCHVAQFYFICIYNLFSSVAVFLNLFLNAEPFGWAKMFAEPLGYLTEPFCWLNSILRDSKETQQFLFKLLRTYFWSFSQQNNYTISKNDKKSTYSRQYNWTWYNRYLAEPLEDARGTPEFRGTPVEKHWSME
jgi:hypothetical protein